MGHTRAQFYLGDIYFRGLGVEKDFDTAFYWFLRSAEQGNDSSGQNMVGYMYHNGYGTHQDLSKARYWYEKSAAQGHQGAINNLNILNSVY